MTHYHTVADVLQAKCLIDCYSKARSLQNTQPYNSYNYRFYVTCGNNDIIMGYTFGVTHESYSA